MPFALMADKSKLTQQIFQLSNSNSFTVSFEITDYYEEYIKTGKMYLQVEDYALNSVVYQIIPGRFASPHSPGFISSIIAEPRFAPPPAYAFLTLRSLSS